MQAKSQQFQASQGMDYRKFLLILFGAFITVSHIFSVNVGMNIKVPEAILAIFIFFFLTRPTVTKNSAARLVLLVLFITVVFLPFISNLFGLLIMDEVKNSVAQMGVFEGLGRKSVLFSPWIMLVWNIFSFLTVLAFSEIKEDEYRILMKFICISIFVSNLYSIYMGVAVNLYGLHDIPWPGDVRHIYANQLRTQGFFIEPLNLGHFLIYAIPLLCIKERFFKKPLAWFIFQPLNACLTILCLILTMSTTAAFAVLFGFGLTLIFSNKFSWKFVTGFFGIFACLIGIAFTIPATRHAFITKVVESITAPEEIGESALERIHRDLSGYEIFKKYPIFGAGLNNSGLLYPIYRPSNSYLYYDANTFPSNEIIRLGAETGTVGLLAFLIFCILYLRFLKLNEQYFSRPEIVLYMGGFLGTLAAFQFSTFFNVYFIWAFVGLSFATVRMRKVLSNPETLVRKHL